MSIAARLAQIPHEVARIVANHLPALQRILNRIEARFVRRFGRSPVSLVFATPVLVLDTVGRRSGRTRSTPLAYGLFDLGESCGRQLVIVGGAAGQRRVPDWVANLRTEPRATVVINGVARVVEACEVTGPDRAGLWPQLVQRWPRIEDYQSHAGRMVPVFVLDEPATDALG